MDDYRKYCERPVRKKDSVTHSMYDTPGSHNKESDDSDDEEMLPMGGVLAHTGKGLDSGGEVTRKTT